jgi:flagellar biosynthesis/type III secretory pathway protein FliH
MSFFLINTGDQSLGSNSALIKKQDRQNFIDSMDMLSHAGALRAKAEATYAAEAERGYADGFATGHEAIESEFLAEIQKLAASIDANATARREEIANVAFAAAQAIVGAIDQTEAVRGIVDQVIKRSDSGQVATVHLNPEKCDVLRQLGGFPETVELVANPALGPTDCEIVTANGKIIASMELQFAALAQRWAVGASVVNDAEDEA